MEKSSTRKKNIDMLEEIQYCIKDLLSDTDQLKKDIHYIKTNLQMEKKVKQDMQNLNKEDISVGWRLW